jgi:hypothetical protein
LGGFEISGQKPANIGTARSPLGKRLAFFRYLPGINRSQKITDAFGRVVAINIRVKISSLSAAFSIG